MRLTFSEAAKKALKYEPYYHSHPRVRFKTEVLWLKSQSLAHQEISRLAGVSDRTLRSYFQEHVEGGSGIGRLKDLHFRRPQSLLMAYPEKINAYFRDCLRPPPIDAGDQFPNQ